MNPLLAELFERADASAARRGYRFLSVDVDRERARLRAAGRAHQAPEAPACPVGAMDDTAHWVLENEARRRGLGARLAAFAGAASVPGEWLGRSLALLRLAQRLGLVYGFDPRDDRGQTALWRALAAGLEVELPAHAPLVPRASRLLGRDDRALGSTLARAVLRQAGNDAVADVPRFVPVLGGLTRPSTDPALYDAGLRMIGVLSRLAEPGPFDRAAEAEEV